MGYYIHVVTVFVIGNTILKEVVTVMIGNYIHRVNVIKGSLFSREYGIVIYDCHMTGVKCIKFYILLSLKSLYLGKSEV